MTLKPPGLTRVLSAFGSAFRILRQKPMLLKWAVLPWLALGAWLGYWTFLTFTQLSVWLVTWFPALAGAAAWIRFVAFIFGGGIFLSLGIVSGFVVTRILLAPFIGLMAGDIVSHLKSPQNERGSHPSGQFFKQVFRGLIRSIMLVPIIIFISILALVPGMQLLAWWLGAFLLVMDLFDYVLEARDVSLKERLLMPLKFPQVSLPFALVVGLTVLVPGLMLVIWPLHLTAAAILSEHLYANR